VKKDAAVPQNFRAAAAFPSEQRALRICQPSEQPVEGLLHLYNRIIKFTK
jgi:hypothetical protein